MTHLRTVKSQIVPVQSPIAPSSSVASFAIDVAGIDSEIEGANWDSG